MLAAAAGAVALAGSGRTEGPISEPAAAPSALEVGRVSGVVRDGSGRPIARARVRHVETGESDRTDRRGRYVLRLDAGGRTLAASAPGFLPHVRADAAERVDFDLWDERPAAETVNSADRLILWGSCDEIARLDDAGLDRWRRRGVDGFVCMVGRLEGLGGAQRFSAHADARLAGRPFALQRQLRKSRLVDRARRHGMKMYLGFYAASSANRSTPFAEWFDDAGWRGKVLPAATRLAGAARDLGFAGVALDQELYDARGATWSWRYPGRSRNEARVRRQVRKRGAELMRALARGYPDVELVAYHTQLPESWGERVQGEINGHDRAFKDNVQVDLWDGMTSVPQYRAIRWFDATFYKVPHLPGVSWDEALQQNARATYALASRRFSGWGYAAGRVQLSPFAWVSSGPSEFERARDPAHVAEQLEAFRRWGTGREFGNYTGPSGLEGFDYGRYEAALRTASRPGRVDSAPPVLRTPASPLRAGPQRFDLTGTAVDDFAIRVLRWRDSRGQEGTARLHPEGDGAAVRWTIDDLPVGRGSTRLWLRLEDIKGLATVTELRIER